ncbi:hypothetical protein BC777_3771 [Yoonia maricola]|uniref:Uncharacterized protein n=1 Tax=Yoonia maricola TaxID=420999 RepID=A0A2M8VZY4_9RHOB|nr:hypothetical protein [Yoonia maricola]PJI84231.1 hypothetical protein BC777_3771 [Yoonia maricola]
MSFLPYAPVSSGTWATAISGSTVLHGGLVVLLATSSITLLPDPSGIPLRAPEYEITLEILDLPAIEPADDPRAIPEDAIPLDPVLETAAELEAVIPDTIAPVAEATPIQPEPEEAMALEPAVEPDFTEPEPLPVPTDPAPVPLPDPDALAIDDLSPIDDTIVSPLAETVSIAPIIEPQDAPIAQELTLLEEPPTDVVLPEPVAPLPDDVVLLPDVDGTADPVGEPPLPDVSPGDDPVTGDTGGALVDNPTIAMQSVAQLLQRIRAASAPACTMALPRLAGADTAGLALIGADAAALDQYAAVVLDGSSFAVTQSRELLDPAQCAVVDMIRQIESYPATRLGLAMPDTTLVSGDRLRATVTGASGLFLTLLLIDDGGVVQDLARFTTLQDDTAVVDVPVARVGQARTTRQAFVAIGTQDAPLDLAASIGGSADDVLGSLPTDVLRGAVFGLVTFDVR